jgi:hypothetical protein
MKVERSTKHARYMYDLATRINARVSELLAGGMQIDEANKQANEEIVKPELRKRAEVRRNV